LNIDSEVLEWHQGDPNVLLLLAHATGFCKEMWRPVVDDLRRQGVTATALAWDGRGHGQAPRLEMPVSWWTFAEDLVEIIRRLEADGRLPDTVVGVGHSMGGTVLVLAETLRPGTFSGLALVEPVLIPPPFVRNPGLGLAQGAARRRPWFSSRQELVETYLSKPLFRHWHPDVFRAYIDHGFREAPEGGLTLRCEREVEAEVFTTGAECGAFSHLSELEAPTRLVITGHSGDLAPALAELPEAFPNATTTYMKDQNHLVPMERPDLVAEEIKALLQSLT